ncbi:MAG: FxLYD domain-containing protein, partial [Anaerolineae bacterium]|nr:FxLYD domain-containing protein [Anaerolineae bacterium]
TGPDHIPPVIIQPVPPPGQAEASGSVQPQVGPPDDMPQSIQVAQLQPTATDTPPPSPTASPSPSPTATPPPSATPTQTPTRTPTVTTTPSPTNTASPTVTPTQSPTPTPPPTNTPQPTATPTRMPTSTLTPTRRPSPTSTKTPLPTITPASALAALGSSAPVTAEQTVSAVTSSSSLVDRPGAPSRASAEPATFSQALASNTGLLDAVPLTNGSIALSWAQTARAAQYRLYSDMGSGFGIYVYKARTDQPTFIDTRLRSGRTYSYRLTMYKANQELVLAQVRADTFATAATIKDTLTDRADVTTASVMAAPTPLPSDAVLLGLVSDNSYTDEFNSLTIVGEVRNDSSLDAGKTDITVTFYDNAGTVIGSASGKVLFDSIPPGDKSPFLISVTRPNGFASYSIRAVARPVPARQSAQLDVVEVRRFEDDTGFFHIKGIIENVGSTVAKQTKIAAIIYGRDNSVINVGFAYVNPPTLAPGQQARYEIIFAYFPRYLTQQVVPFEE